MMTNKLYSIKTVITGTTGIKSIHILYLKLNFEVFQKKEHLILTNKDSIIQVREAAHERTFLEEIPWHLDSASRSYFENHVYDIEGGKGREVFKGKRIKSIA